jgi:hypothetical protein
VDDLLKIVFPTTKEFAVNFKRTPTGAQILSLLETYPGESERVKASTISFLIKKALPNLRKEVSSKVQDYLLDMESRYQEERDALDSMDYFDSY